MSTLTANPPSRAAHLGLWAGQLLLAVAFLGAGAFKTFTPIEELAGQMSWVTQVPAAVVRTAGVSELLGAVGLVLPAALRIAPWLTPLAGAALAVVMVLGAITHVSVGDPLGAIVPSIVLGTLAAGVAWGRFKVAPIAGR